MHFSLDNITSENLVIVFVGYVICFVTLALLCLVFQNLPALLKVNFKTIFNTKRSENSSNELLTPPGHITGEETAAISAAIYLFINELHDEEATVLTIEKITKRYSPWNSKIYNVIKGLNKRF